jgi:GPH family glycoside/pentoside/hexuronide:cation symporter
MWILAYYGYKANQPQTAESIFGIKMMMSFIPAVIAGLSIIPLLFYKLDEEKLEKIEKELRERKKEA